MSVGVSSANPVTVEVIRVLLSATVDEIEQNLVRTSYSPVVYEIRDVAVAWLDVDGQIIAQGKTGLPIFMADLSAPVRDGLEIFGIDGFRPGDVVLTNHSGTCGQHLNNIVVYSPIFGDSGRVLAFTAARTHWTDVGGGAVGSWDTESRDIFSEGIQLRSVKIMKGGEWDEELLRIIRHNTRFSSEAMGDLNAQVGACRLGERRFVDLLTKYGLEVVMDAIHTIWQQSERLAEDFIRKIPDGCYEAETCLDDDGINIGRPIRVHARVVVSDNTMEIDYSGMSDQVEGPINSGRSGGIAAARVAFKYLTTPDFPADEGCFRPLKVTLPEGKFISAREPAPMGLWSTPLPTVIDVTLRALSQAIPDTIPAAHMGDQGPWVIQGLREDGSLFYHVDSGAGGMGAWRGGDGADAVKGLAHGDSYTIPVESEERLYPLRLLFFRLRDGSGGAGEWRGGLGSERCYEVLQDCTSNLWFDRSVCPPWGLFGGHDGEPSGAVITRPGDAPEPFRKATGVPLPAGSTLHVWSAGGGGYGDPTQRDPAVVLSDVIRGFVSRKVAEDVYGIAFAVDDNGRIDIDRPATSNRRQ